MFLIIFSLQYLLFLKLFFPDERMEDLEEWNLLILTCIYLENNWNNNSHIVKGIKNLFSHPVESSPVAGNSVIESIPWNTARMVNVVSNNVLCNMKLILLKQMYGKILVCCNFFEVIEFTPTTKKFLSLLVVVLLYR